MEPASCVSHEVRHNWRLSEPPARFRDARDRVGVVASTCCWALGYLRRGRVDGQVECSDHVAHVPHGVREFGIAGVGDIRLRGFVPQAQGVLLILIGRKDLPSEYLTVDCRGPSSHLARKGRVLYLSHGLPA